MKINELIRCYGLVLLVYLSTTTVVLANLFQPLSFEFEGQDTDVFIAVGNLNPNINCDEMPASRRLKLNRGRLGGDYWNSGFSVGQKDNCFLDTGYKGEQSGKLLSAPFIIKEQVLSFLIGAGGSSKTEVALEILKDQLFEKVYSTNGPGPAGLERINWDLSDYRGKTARLLIRDEAIELSDSNLPYLLVDNIQFTNQALESQESKLWGLADLHAHLFNHLGFGGRQFHGKVWSKKGPQDALKSCRISHGWGPTKGVSSLTPEFGHRRSGYPDFDGWPKYSSLVHQHAYTDFLKRSWEGGMRLIVMDVGNSAFMAKAFKVLNFHLKGKKNPLPIDDMSVIRIQIAAAQEYVAIGPGKEFAEIAYSPADARRIIKSGKLALVLGIEVETLGNYFKPEDLGSDPKNEIKRLVKEIVDIGIRKVIAIHLIDNVFGAPAIYERLFASVNRSENGFWPRLKDGFSSGYRYQLLEDPGTNPVTWFFEKFAKTFPKKRMNKMMANISENGLTDAGKFLIKELMRNGLLVDIDHMGFHSTEDTLSIAETYNYPIVASHTGFNDLAFGNEVTFSEDSFDIKPFHFSYNQNKEAYGTSDVRKLSSERRKSLAQLARIKVLGGIIGMGLGGGEANYSWRNKIQPNCDGTTKSFAQTYLYALEVLGPDHIAFGTDVNGLAGLPAPRFGTEACAGMNGDALRAKNERRRKQAFSQRNGVRYDSPLHSSGDWRFGKNDKGDAAPYGKLEADFWWALTEFEKKTKKLTHGKFFRKRRVNRMLQGLYAAELDKLDSTYGYRTPRNKYAKRAYQAYFGKNMDNKARTDLVAVYNSWKEMKSGSNPALKRSQLGNREFDVNIDGVAHYGLIPDYLQDAVNTGLPKKTMRHIFNGAENLVRVWEKSQKMAKAIPQ